MDTRTVKLNGKTFTLGKKYCDERLGCEGIATASVCHLTGCDQILLEWNDSTGRPVSHWIDVTRVAAVQVEKRPGGPAPAIPVRHP